MQCSAGGGLAAAGGAGSGRHEGVTPALMRGLPVGDLLQRILHRWCLSNSCWPALHHADAQALLAAHRPLPVPLTAVAQALGFDSADEAAEFIASQGATVDREAGVMETKPQVGPPKPSSAPQAAGPQAQAGAPRKQQPQKQEPQGAGGENGGKAKRKKAKARQEESGKRSKHL